MLGCSAIMSTGIGVASFGLFFEEASFAAPHQVQLRRDTKVVAAREISAASRRPQIDAQPVELVAVCGRDPADKALSATGVWELGRIVRLSCVTTGPSGAR